MTGPPGHLSPGDPFDDFHQWVGICITGWAHVETQLMAICWKCMGTRVDLAAIVYYRTPAVSSRLGLCDELLQATLPRKPAKSGAHDHPDMKTWKAIQVDVGKLLKLRNRIAHNPMSADLNAKNDGFSVWIEQSFSDGLRPKGQLHPLHRADLVKHAADVQDVTRRLTSFFQDTLSKYVE